jgi:hypothetical protein
MSMPSSCCFKRKQEKRIAGNWFENRKNGEFKRLPVLLDT